MIIRQDQRGSKFSPRMVVYLLGAVAVLVAVFLVLRQRGENKGPSFVSCDMETVEKDGDKIDFVDGDIRFAHGERQSDMEAYSGRYSCLLHSEAQFGATWEISNVKPGDIYEARIWRKSPKDNGTFIASGDWGLYQRGLLTGETAPGGWHEILLTIEIPKYVKNGVLKGAQQRKHELVRTIIIRILGQVF